MANQPKCISSLNFAHFLFICHPLSLKTWTKYHPRNILFWKSKKAFTLCSVHITLDSFFFLSLSTLIMLGTLCSAPPYPVQLYCTKLCSVFFWALTLTRIISCCECNAMWLSSMAIEALLCCSALQTACTLSCCARKAALFCCAGTAALFCCAGTAALLHVCREREGCSSFPHSHQE